MTTYIRPPTVIEQQLPGEEMVILDLDTEEYFGLNEVGARVWAGIMEGQTVEEIARAIVSDFDVTEEELTGDAGIFVQELLRRGLLEIEQ